MRTEVASALCRFSPLCDALVRPDDGGLDVDGVVTHPSELHGFLQSADHVQRVMTLYAQTHKHTHTLSFWQKVTTLKTPRGSDG